MAFCKVCDCGEKIVFNSVIDCPDRCPSCNRWTANYQTHDESDPAVEEEIRSKTAQKRALNGKAPAAVNAEPAEKRYCIRLSNGKEIDIPKEGCIIGRTEVGAEELAEFPSVSRQHIRVTLKRRAILIEDLSSYGTLVDGRRIAKYALEQVNVGAKITLCNVETTLLEKEEKSE